MSHPGLCSKRMRQSSMTTAMNATSSSSRFQRCGSPHSRNRKKQTAAAAMLPSDDAAFATPTISSLHRRGMISEI